MTIGTPDGPPPGDGTPGTAAPVRNFRVIDCGRSSTISLALGPPQPRRLRSRRGLHARLRNAIRLMRSATRR